MGIETISHLPTLPISNGDNIDSTKYLMEGFFNKERILTHNFDERRVTLGVDSVLSGNGAICPEYELNPGLYNQLFTGTDFEVKLSLN
jgi:hypothetical protein